MARPCLRLPDPGLRRAADWLNRRGSLAELVRTLREILPGDSRFGDPISTAGAEPAQVLARRAWAASGGHWTVLAELGLATLQVADWLRPPRGALPRARRAAGPLPHPPRH